MVSADLLYNLDLKLREITLRDELFGGISIFAFGDLFQLQPVNGHYVFQEPCNEEHRVAFTLRNLWQCFKVVNLEENHRQGEAKEFGDLLNRVRVGTHTEKDLELLRSRVIPEKECGQPQIYQGPDDSNSVFNLKKDHLCGQPQISQGPDDSNNVLDTKKDHLSDDDPEIPEKECGHPQIFQGPDKSNNVINTKKQTVEDLEQIFQGPDESNNVFNQKKDHLLDDNPEIRLNSALHIYGKNAPVTARNNAVLNDMPGELFTIKARNMHRTIKNWKPQTDNAGCVKNTPFQSILKLKKGAEVILTLNVNTVDGLTNGARGVLLGVEKKNGAVSKLIVEFHNPDHGREQRERNPCKRFKQGTYIEPVLWQYIEKGLTAKVFQFPVRLAASITSHKIQVGLYNHTIKRHKYNCDTCVF